MPDQHCTATAHGTNVYAYQRYGCRCPQAVAAMRAKWRRDNKPYQRVGRNPQLSLVVTDIDPVAVDLVVEDGHQLALTVRERKQAAIALARRGWPTWRIADHLNVTARTVFRYRAAA
jgi:hypothetical protein